MNLRYLKITALTGSCVAALSGGIAQAQTGNTGQGASTLDIDDIVITARKREEGLISVPVTVSALSSKDIARYNAQDLTKIGEMTPTVIISSYKAASGGSIAIRGISSPATQIGFEQAVSVSIDGIQTSNGRIATAGFFDLQQVEIMKGPQALYFGKNSSAGVIALTSAGPTPELEIGGRLNYEFVGDEATIESYIAGPITSTLGGRIALRYRELSGWMYNDARPLANPFYTASLPAGVAQLPGTHSHRIGDKDILGRLTLEFDPGDAFRASFKLFGSRSKDDGNGSALQNIGPCPTGQPKVYGIADPFSECRRDNHTSSGDIPAAIAGTAVRGQPDGFAEGKSSVIFSSLNLSFDLDNFNIAGTTGYYRVHNYSFSGLDSSVFSQLLSTEENTDRSFSQEIRLTSDLNGPLNFMVGAFYQHTNLDFFNATKLRDDTGFNAASGRFETWEAVAGLKGRTLSAFGELQWKIRPELELSGGIRWTSERKSFWKQNNYGIGAFNTLATLYPGSTDPTPGVIAGKFRDTNFSPEVTLTYRPDSNSTLFAAYKTGFKSGGFGLQTPLNTAVRLADFDFGSETARGFELGAKGEFFDRRLRLTSALFAYEFKDLQVTTYDATTVSFKINNAGAVRQRGGEIEAQYQVNDSLSLRGALTYVRNKFKDYIGQCYGFSVPAAQALTAAAPPGCSFLLNASGGRFLTATGVPVLQQDFDGRTPPRSPDWAANSGFVFNTPMTDATSLEFAGDAFYSGSYYAGDTAAPSTIQKAFWRFNASVRLLGPDEAWEVGLIGRNLTNKYYLLYAGDRTGGTSVPLTIGEQRGVVARGREVALQFRAKFR